MAAEPSIRLPQVIQAAPIDYPQNTVEQQLEGDVLANLSIDVRGQVLNCEVIESPNPIFSAPACRTT